MPVTGFPLSVASNSALVGAPIFLLFGRVPLLSLSKTFPYFLDSW